MSLHLPQGKVWVDNRIHHTAKEDHYYLLGRILTLKVQNPNYNAALPQGDTNKPFFEYPLYLSKGKADGEGLKYVEVLDKNAIKVRLKDGVMADVPTGIRNPDSNKERVIDVVGPVVIGHGLAHVHKDVGEFLVA